MKKLILTGLILFGLCGPALARTATWDGGGGDALASTAANWDGPDTVPIAGDAVVFDATSANVCTFDLTADFASINTTGYTGTVTASVTMTVSGNLTFANSTFAHGNQLFIWDNAAQAINMGTGNSFYDLDLKGGTKTITGVVEVANTLDFLSGAQTIDTGTIEFSGDFQVTASSSYLAGTGLIKAVGTNSSNFSIAGVTAGQSAYVDFEFARSAGTITLLAGEYRFGVNSSCVITNSGAGTVDATTNTTTLTLNALNMDTDGIDWYDVVRETGGTLTLVSNMQIANDFDVNEQANQRDVSGGFTVSVGGNVSTSGNGRVDWASGASLDVEGNYTTGTSVSYSRNTSFNIGGNFILNAAHDWLNTTITFDGNNTHLIDSSTSAQTFTNVVCDTGDTCNFDDADTFTIGTASGDGTWSSDHATNTVDVDITTDSIAEGVCVRVDSAGGSAISTLGAVTDCVNWTQASGRKVIFMT